MLLYEGSHNNNYIYICVYIYIYPLGNLYWGNHTNYYVYTLWYLNLNYNNRVAILTTKYRHIPIKVT